jgi:hypothetical protein
MRLLVDAGLYLLAFFAVTVCYGGFWWRRRDWSRDLTGRQLLD